jgi:para-nitrobenzyl esterase
MRKLLFFLFILPMTTLAQDKNAFPVQAKTEHGIIEGNYNTHTGIQTYYGVPLPNLPWANYAGKRHSHRTTGMV